MQESSTDCVNQLCHILLPEQYALVAHPKNSSATSVLLLNFSQKKKHLGKELLGDQIPVDCTLDSSFHPPVFWVALSTHKHASGSICQHSLNIHSTLTKKTISSYRKYCTILLMASYADCYLLLHKKFTLWSGDNKNKMANMVTCHSIETLYPQLLP